MLGRPRAWLSKRAGPFWTTGVVDVPSGRPVTQSAISPSTKPTLARSGTSNSPCLCTSRSRATASCLGSLPSAWATSSTRRHPAAQGGHGRQVVALLGPQASPGHFVLAPKFGPRQNQPRLGVGEGDDGLPLGRPPGVPAEQLYVVGMAARAAHQQVEALGLPGYVAASCGLD